MLDHFVKVAFKLSDEKEDSIFVALKSAGLKLPLALENIHRKKNMRHLHKETDTTAFGCDDLQGDYSGVNSAILEYLAILVIWCFW